MGPGQAGDKSGHVTIYTAEGRSCGRAPVFSIRERKSGQTGRSTGFFALLVVAIIVAALTVLMLAL